MAGSVFEEGETVSAEDFASAGAETGVAVGETAVEVAIVSVEATAFAYRPVSALQRPNSKRIRLWPKGLRPVRHIF